MVGNGRTMMMRRVVLLASSVGLIGAAGTIGYALSTDRQTNDEALLTLADTVDAKLAGLEAIDVEYLFESWGKIVPAGTVEPPTDAPLAFHHVARIALLAAPTGPWVYLENRDADDPIRKSISIYKDGVVSTYRYPITYADGTLPESPYGHMTISAEGPELLLGDEYLRVTPFAMFPDRVSEHIRKATSLRLDGSDPGSIGVRMDTLVGGMAEDYDFYFDAATGQLERVEKFLLGRVYNSLEVKSWSEPRHGCRWPMVLVLVNRPPGDKWRITRRTVLHLSLNDEVDRGLFRIPNDPGTIVEDFITGVGYTLE